MRSILASTLAWCVACGSSSSPPALRWVTDDEPAAFARARAEHKGVMITFTARWSLPSREFERVFIAPSVLPVIAEASCRCAST